MSNKARVGLKKYTPTQNLYIMVFGELPEVDVAPEDIPKLVEFVYKHGGRWGCNNKMVMEHLGIMGDISSSKREFLADSHEQYKKWWSKALRFGLRRPLIAQQLKSFYASRDSLCASITELGQQLAETNLEKAMLIVRANLAIQKGVIVEIRDPKEWERAKNPYDVSAEDLGLPEDTIEWLSDYKSSCCAVTFDTRMLSGMPNISRILLETLGIYESSRIHINRVRKTLRDLGVDIAELTVDGRWPIGRK